MRKSALKSCMSWQATKGASPAGAHRVVTNPEELAELVSRSRYGWGFRLAQDHAP